LARYSIEISSKVRAAEARGSAKELDGSFSGNKSVAAHRDKLAHWNAVSGHGERLALVEFEHDPSTVVPQLAPADFPTHAPSVASCATLL